MRSLLFATLLLLGSATICQAQVVMVYQPVANVVTPHVTYYSPAMVPAPTVVQYAPSPYAARTVTYYSSVSSMPVATTVRGVPVAVAPVPVVAYRPAAVAVPAYVIGRGVVGQPKLYVPGQPIRNAVRFSTP